MRPFRSILLAAGAALILAVPVMGQGDEPTVNGRIVLPEGSTLEGASVWTLQVQDTSLADAPAVTIGQDGGVVADESATEIAFAAGFDPEAIDQSLTYTLSARIMGVEGDLRTQVHEWLLEQHFRIVTTSLVELLKALDEALMSHEQYHVTCSAFRDALVSPSTPSLSAVS